jgi:NAD(P)-dependent dehydrogenase (short-subunit alcohol dehydrogenase family)
MRELAGKVAVITGAASGFGREFAFACAQEGMRLSLTDVDERGLAETAALVAERCAGTPAITQRCDVANAADVESLAARTYQEFGATHLLFNNAGIGVSGPTWTATLDDWTWSIGVNLMGVVHGIRSFVPRMLAAGEPGHIVNTASVAGFLSVPGSAVYCATKHAVVTLSECLLHDLALAKSRLGVSVLAPAFVNTGIAESARNRPATLAATNPLAKPFEDRVRQAVRSGKLSAEDVARITMDAVKADRFYIFTHPAIKPSIDSRMREILTDAPPTNPMP